VPVERARLGKTGIEVLRLGFGGIPIQSLPEEEAIAVVRFVLDQGMDFIDTARGYTNSEERIGKVLAARGQRPIISSKSPVRSAEEIQEQFQISLQTLGVERIDIYNVHAVNTHEQYETVMGPGGAYEGLERGKDKGLIGHIGITSHSLHVLERALDEDHFETVMVGYSLLEPEAEEKVIPMARDKDVGIIAMKSLAGGVIESGILALKYVLACPDVIVIPGLHTIDQARENWQAFSGDWTYTPEEQRQVGALRKEFSGQFCRRCDYCQPCPEDIPIQVVMGLKRIVKNFGDNTDQLVWLVKAVEAARNCRECGECETKCPYSLPIRDMIEENLAWLDERQDG
jgi:predicted aldo/keto reductase-like oxidoreductase